jgi:hypothetical protein
MSHSELKALFEKRQRALTAFNQWEAEHYTMRQDVEQVFAALGTLYDLLPPASRHRQEDPTRSGIQTMHRALRYLH